MTEIKRILNDFKTNHENELFTSQLVDELEGQIIDAINRICLNYDDPLKQIELELNSHEELRIDDLHVFTIDFEPKSKLCKFDLIHKRDE